MAGEWFYLREDERVLARLKPAPAYAVALFAQLAAIPTLLLAGAYVFHVLVPAFPPFPFEYLVAVWAILLLAAAFALWRRVATSEVALTDQRIYARVGKLITRVHFTTHDKVTDIHYRQGPLDRWIGVASLTFSTAGGDVAAWGVRDAIALKRQAEGARDAFIRGLLAEAGVEELAAHGAAGAAGAAGAVGTVGAAASAANGAPGVAGGVAAPPAPPIPVPEWSGPRPDYLQPGETPVWYAKPRPISALASLRSLVGLLVLLVFSRFMADERRLFVVIGVVGVAFILVSVRLMQLRRTEYVSTDRRVYARRGLVGTTVNQLTYDKITDITLHQDLLGRLFGYSGVTVQTAGGNQAPITMVGLPDGLAAKAAIEQWRDRSLSEGRR